MNYQESEISGSEHTRCHSVRIENPLAQTPQIIFGEEVVLQLADRAITTASGQLQIAFDPAKVVPLLHPETLEPVGASMTMQQLYLGLFGAYIQAATERDTQAADQAAQAAAEAERVAQEQAAEAQRRADEAAAKVDEEP